MSTLEERLSKWPWQQAREGVALKLGAEAGEVYVLAKSQERANKVRGIRRRQLKYLWQRLHELKKMEPSRDTLLMKLGAARHQAPKAWRLVKVKVPGKNKPDQPWEFSLRKDKLRQVRQREGGYLLRSNMTGRPGVQLWERTSRRRSNM